MGDELKKGKNTNGVFIDVSNPKKRYMRYDPGAKEIEWSDHADFYDVDGRAPNFFPNDGPAEAYAELRKILTRAYNQAVSGKGKERHATGNSFEDQPIMSIQELLGSNHGPLFRAMEKIQESTRLDSIKAVIELLGAIVYLAAAIIFIEEKENCREG